MLAKSIRAPLKGFLTLRSFHYFLQFQILSRLTYALPFVENLARPVSKRDFKLLYDELQTLVNRDVDNIIAGHYPLQVLKPESPFTHTLRLPKLFFDGITLSWRRQRRAAKVFSARAQELAKEVPEYYRRNFHFQTDGYLSEHSAELYDHQVELLFSGMADAMRRLFLPDLKRLLHESGRGDRVDLLETACGTGRTTRFVRLALPESRIVATDLSAPYLKVARRKLAELTHIGYLEANAAHLPFTPETFDAVYNVFFFHELPREERVRVVREAYRVLRPGGLFAVVDSLQLGDRPEFDKHLRRFPREYHEPFYADYIAHPMDKIFAAAGFTPRATGTGFLSRYWVVQK